MGTIQIVSIILVVFGVLISIFAIFAKSRNNRESGSGERQVDYFEYERSIKEMNQSINEMDKAIDEFHKTSGDVFKELDEKHQELLFLYSLIDEKKKEVADLYNAPQAVKAVPLKAAVPQAPQAVAEAPPKAARVKTISPSADKNKSSHPRRKDILNLHRQGLSVPEIAEELNVGQDMVQLILQLGKAR